MQNSGNIYQSLLSQFCYALLNLSKVVLANCDKQSEKKEQAIDWTMMKVLVMVYLYGLNEVKY